MCKYFRVEYDAYRSDLEVVTHSPRTDSNTATIEEAHRNYELHKQHFMKLRGEVAIKMKFLEENRVSYLIFFVGNLLLLFSTTIIIYVVVYLVIVYSML